jgi:hypothetical protein
MTILKTPPHDDYSHSCFAANSSSIRTLLTLTWHTQAWQDAMGNWRAELLVNWHSTRTKKHVGTLALILAFLLLMPFVQQASFAQGADRENPATSPNDPVIIATSFNGPYIQVWQAIITEAGIPYKTVDVLQGRRRRMFEHGLLTMDCCFKPSWRNRPEEQRAQLFTDSIVVTEIRYIFKKGNVQPVRSLDDVSKLRFALVRGFNYTLEDYFTKAIRAKSIGDTLRLVEVGRADVAQASRIQFEYEMAKKVRNLEMGGIANYSNLHARVHISRADLLPRLNAAIAKMKKNGRIQKILADAVPQ